MPLYASWSICFKKGMWGTLSVALCSLTNTVANNLHLHVLSHLHTYCTKTNFSHQKRLNPKVHPWITAAPDEPATLGWVTWHRADCSPPSQSAAPTSQSPTAPISRLLPPAAGSPARQLNAASATLPSPARRTLPLP